jgi:hypothetical protein
LVSQEKNLHKSDFLWKNLPNFIKFNTTHILFFWYKVAERNRKPNQCQHKTYTGQRSSLLHENLSLSKVFFQNMVHHAVMKHND